MLRLGSSFFGLRTPRPQWRMFGPVEIGDSSTHQGALPCGASRFGLVNDGACAFADGWTARSTASRERHRFRAVPPCRMPRPRPHGQGASAAVSREAGDPRIGDGATALWGGVGRGDAVRQNSRTVSCTLNPRPNGWPRSYDGAAGGLRWWHTELTTIVRGANPYQVQGIRSAPLRHPSPSRRLEPGAPPFLRRPSGSMVTVTRSGTGGCCWYGCVNSLRRRWDQSSWSASLDYGAGSAPTSVRHTQHSAIHFRSLALTFMSRETLVLARQNGSRDRRYTQSGILTTASASRSPDRQSPRVSVQSSGRRRPPRSPRTSRAVAQPRIGSTRSATRRLDGTRCCVGLVTS